MANKLPFSKFITEKIIGIDRKRNMPKISSYTFESWFKKRKANTTVSRVKIVFFHDTHINYIHPEVGKSAVKILESAGYEVEITDRKCCGRTLISKGLLEEAKNSNGLEIYGHSHYNIKSLEVIELNSIWRGN